ncbi:MAG TPA: nucleoside-diphosphate kinase [Anaerolineae bacterium]|nr:nucleoside-diphosphate kinase [Anaerolineae bacterium]
MERTLVLLKPDAVQRGLIGVIIGRLEQRGLRLAGMKFLQVPLDLARRHYAVHKGKPFYAGLLQYITSSPIVAMVWEGPRAIEVVRRTVGSTNPADADPGTVRADYAVEIGRNLVHASDGPETAAYEIPLWFDESQMVTWSRELDKWIME